MLHMMRLLLVEDSPNAARVVQRQLTMVGLPLPEWVRSAEEAADRIAEQNYDVILLDWTLPGMSGLDLLRQVRADADEATAALPVLMLTAHDFTADVLEAVEAGADDYLLKPVSPEALRHKIRRLTVRSRPTSVGSPP